MNPSVLTRLTLLMGILLVAAAFAPTAVQAITFAGPTYGIGVAPQSVEAHDFNRDSKLDLLIANEAPHTSLASISVLLGVGNGSFTRQPDIAFGTRRPTSTAVDDFNGDSKLDFAVANYESNDVSVLLGTGNGTFTAPANFALAPGSFPVSIATGDFNGDSQPDLVVANEATSNISVLLGVGDGTFSGPTHFPLLTSSGPQSVVVGRFDSDPHLDLALADKLFNRVLLLLGAGDGTFSNPTQIGVGVDPTALAVGEFNGDSDPDLASANESSHNVSVLLGSSGGTFTAPPNSTFAAGSIPDAVAAGDLNGDSEPDLAVANQLSDNVSVLIGGSAWSFTGPVNFPAGDGSTAVAIDNFNGDPWPDLAVTAEISNTVSILLATPPDTTINSGPTFTNNSPPPTFTFSSNDPNATFRCRVDGNAFSSCSSPYTTSSPHGNHTFEVRATDDAGRTDPTPAVRAFTVDTQAPPAPTLSGTVPASPANENNPRVRGTAEAGAAVRLYTDAACSGSPGATGPAAGFTAPGLTVTVPDNSTTRFYATATDQAGNVSGCSTTSVTYVEISSPPETTITSGPSGLTNDSNATFSFSSDQSSATFECSLDAGSWVSCTSPESLTALSEGEHAFSVRALSPNGNLDPTPATAAFSVDTVGPQTSILSKPVDPTNETSATFTFSSDEPGSTFECRLSGETDFIPCTSPKTYTGLIDGAKSFRVRAIDQAGNRDLDTTRTRYDWTVNTSLPETTIDSAPSDPTNSTSATFTFSSSEVGSTFECKLDTGSWSPCTSPKPFTDLSEDQHSFSVRAIDPAGNYDSVEATRTWTVDLTAPGTTISSGVAGTINSTSATFEFSSSEPGSTFECELDGGGWASCASPEVYDGLSEGGHMFLVRATDRAGNTDTAAASDAWSIDTTPPETSITVAPPPTTGSTSATFRFFASEGGSSFFCRKDDANWSPCSSPWTYSGLSNGSHSFEVSATDAVGNFDPTPALMFWTVDTSIADTTPLVPPPASEPAKPPAAGVGNGGVFDTMSPDLVMFARGTQRAVKQKGIVVEVACLAEACTATARGRILASGTARMFSLNSVSAQIAKGGGARLKLGLSKRTLSRMRRVLKKGKKVSARVVVTATDVAGNTATDHRRIRLAP